MSYRETRFCENWNILQPETVGKYDIPVLEPCYETPWELVGFNFAKTEKDKSKGIHFFIDDYQFESRLWRTPEKSAEVLKDFSCVLTPDFSLYTDFPMAMQIYNHYRKHWLGAYWQSLGMNVIPTIAWSDEKSFEWCFDGEPTQSTVAVSSVGTQRNKETKKLFLDGWDAMIDKLHPETVIFYGSVPKECMGNIVRVKAFQDKFREAKVNGW